jgi:multidrug resistance efflux pump
MQDQAASVAEPAPSRSRLQAIKATLSNFPGKPLKVAVAAGVLCAGAFGVLSENRFISTSDAVVSTYVLAVRTPVEGTVTGLPLSSGVMVRQGQPLGQIDNPLADHQHLDNLKSLEEEAEATADAIESEQQALLAQRRRLVERSNNQIAAVQDRLNRELAEAEQLVQARQLEFDEAAREADRARQLHGLGVMSQADYDKIVSAEGVAARQLSAQKAEMESVKLQLASAARGILIEPGMDNDVPYSRQRADELSIRLADNARILTASLVRAQDAQNAVAEESGRTQLMEHSPLTSPIDALIWKLNAVNGEHAAAGDTVVSLVDCRRQFILAEIPQDRLPDVAVHQKATYRLAGEPNERTGTVLSVSGDSLGPDESSLAALPNKNSKKELALVLIAIENPSQGPAECLVGRDARVLIPALPNNPVGRWLRFYF